MACVMDYTSIFTTNKIFTRDSLIEWTHEMGKENGMVIVIKSSEKGGCGRKPRLTFSCERSGIYRGASKNYVKKKQDRDTGTKKCGCPFQLKGINLSSGNEWAVEVVCGVHNHAMLNTFEGHSFVGRLSQSDTSVLIDLSKSLVKPRQILSVLKNRDEKNTSTLKSIYNARQKYRLGEMAGRSQMQQLLHKLSEYKYLSWYTNNPMTEAVDCLFYAHPSSVKFLRSFPEILIMDCTYKTNRYKLPLFQIVGVTSTELTFTVAFAYLQSENEKNYTWALNKLKMLLDGCIMPRVILTDRELALMNACGKVFPNTANHLCRWHINRNIQAHCKKLFDTKERWESFIQAWNSLVTSTSEEKYAQNLGDLERNFKAFPAAIDYVNESWLFKYKEQFVAAWTDRQPHFGNSTTNRAESAHAKLKRYLGASNISFEESWKNIHSLLELQHTEVRSSFEKSMCTVQHKYKPSVFKELRNFISKSALDVVLFESTRADSIGPYAADICGCNVRRTHGLPCAHEIAQYKLEGRPIPLSSIHAHWKILELVDCRDDIKSTISCTFELEQIQKRFDAANDATKLHLLNKLKEMANPSTSCLQEPDMKSNTRGRPTTKLKYKRNITGNSTTREPSLFEYVENSIAEQIQPIKKLKFTPPLRQYITKVEDVKADGNCGFRCIASYVGYEEEGWPQVRKDLINELETNKHDYMLMYGNEILEELKVGLNYFDRSQPCVMSHWMTMPEMGHLIASCYNVVVVHISSCQCLTFLPLRSVSKPQGSHSIYGLGFVNGNHFVKVILSASSPIPPIAIKWNKHRYDCAKGWELHYNKRIDDFKAMVGLDVATQEEIVDLS